MCDIKCDVSATKKHTFKIGDLDVAISQGSYNSATISVGAYPYLYNRHVSFGSLQDFKNFCEQSLKCLKKIEDES